MRNVIWASATVGFAFTLLVLVHFGVVHWPEGAGGTAAVALLLCVAVVSALLRRFVQRNFDEHGNWTGRWY